MNTKQHALVIGGSLAGLSAAQVLSKYFDRVTILERDRMDGEPYGPESEYRPGVPQSRHAHNLQPLGQSVLEELFPGVKAELLQQGAVGVDPSRDISFFENGSAKTPRSRPGQVNVMSSRSLLEQTLHRRVLGLANVEMLSGLEVLGLLAAAGGRQVSGVRIRERHTRGETTLAADLVLDASGRQSRAAAWLETLGFTPPQVSMIDAHSGYASRIYRRPESLDGAWKMLYIRPGPPDHTRGGIVIPLEGRRMHVTLTGMAGDFPSTHENGFLDFARSLPSPLLYEALREAEPLSGVHGYRSTANRLRHFESLPAYLEGFLVSGDAVFTLNPVYAQGMTAALLESKALNESLARQAAGDRRSLAKDFQLRLAGSVQRVVELAIDEDLRWDGTEAEGPIMAFKGGERNHHLRATGVRRGLFGSGSLRPSTP